MENQTFYGQLAIDRARGVIYFHTDRGYTILRIQNLPTPIPKVIEDKKKP